MYCSNCGTELREEALFCHSCGQPVPKAQRLIMRKSKTLTILSQLDEAHAQGRISKSLYAERKRAYLAELDEIGRHLQRAQPDNKTKPKEIPTFVSSPHALEAQESISGFSKEAVYADPPPLPWSSVMVYVVAAVVLVGGGLYLTWATIGLDIGVPGLELIWLEKSELLAFSAIGPVIYLTWMYRHDKFEREPWYYVALILGWGGFSGFLAFWVNTGLDVMGLGIVFLTPPIVEETLKSVGVYKLAGHPEFNDSMDGMVYGFAAGMGFALVENFFYIVAVYEGDLFLGALRVFLFGLGHGLWTAMTGRALGYAKSKKGYVDRSDLMKGLVIAILGHGLYNSFLIDDLLVWPILVHGAFVLLLMYFIRKAWSRERIWRYDSGLAPTAR